MREERRGVYTNPRISTGFWILKEERRGVYTNPRISTGFWILKEWRKGCIYKFYNIYMILDLKGREGGVTIQILEYLQGSGS